jgi:hypothetical protein
MLPPTAARAQRHLEGHANDDQHGSNSDGLIVGIDAANDTDDQHKQAHQADTS